jgi:hypothetical protein
VGSSHGLLAICIRSIGNAQQLLASGGVKDIQGLAAFGVHPFAFYV